MTQKKQSIFKTEVMICARKYCIVDSDGNVLHPRVCVSFMTEDGFFAAPLPRGVDHDTFRKYENCELRELPYDHEDVYCAGKIEKCTSNGFYGRFYKDCIHRAREERDLYYTIRSSRWIQQSSVGLWVYHNHPYQRIYRSEITALPNKDKHFSAAYPERNRTEDLTGAIVMQGWFLVGVVLDAGSSEHKALTCIAAEKLLRELCSYREYITDAIAKGILQEDEEPKFYIHGGVLEQYRGQEETVIVPEGVHVIGKQAFRDNQSIRHLILPETVTIIGDYAFEGCLFLQTVSFPSNLTEIGLSAFKNCRSLNSIELPDSLTKLGPVAFCYCDSLISVTLPSRLPCIEDSAFRSCTSLQSVVIPDSVEKIGGDAFRFCKKLSEVQLPESVQLNSGAFGNTPWYKKQLRKNGALIIGDKLVAVYEKLTKYNIPDHVTCIGKFAFCKSNVEQLLIPEHVTKIEYGAFCLSKIKQITLPENLTEIEDWTFARCHQLEELVLSKRVVTIGECALFDLPNCVVTILNDAEDAENMGDYSFGNNEHPACVKEVRTYYGSKAMRSARVWNLPCVCFGAKPRKYTYVEEDFCCKGTTLVQYLGHSRFVRIPEGITEIGDYAFRDDHSGAEQIVLPMSVNTIGRGAFLRCESLRTITGEGVTEIKTSAFVDAHRLEKAYFPAATEWAEDSFQFCASLKEDGLLLSKPVVIDERSHIISKP